MTATPGTSPRQPIRRTADNATRKLLAAAALMMSVLLIVSSFVTALLIPEAHMHTGGEAAGRALAYLAHAYLGHAFGTVYDL